MNPHHVSTVKSHKGKEIPIFTQLFINNNFVDSLSKTTINIINPCTETIICQVAEGRQADIDLAVEAAMTAFPIWSNMPLDERVNLFLKLADKLESEAEDYTYLETLDNGKILEDSKDDIDEVVRIIRFYAGAVDKIMGQTFTPCNDYTIHTRRVPYGPVGLISPWNYPLVMSAWKIFPALAAGNTVIHKPSEETPLTILKLCNAMKVVGFPDGVMNCVPGYGHLAGDRLTSHPDILKVSFTGSTGVGRLIMKNSATSNLKNVTLELGGKSPIVVHEDADLELAAIWVIDASYRNTAQNCCAGSRIYVHEKVHDEFLKLIKEKILKIKVGSQFELGNFFGPVINERQFNSVLGYIEHGIEIEKLRPEFGGKRLFDKGYYIQPTLFTGVPDTSKLAREEIFGPVMLIMTPFKTLREAVFRANDTTYGLAAGIFSKDQAACEYYVRNVNAGTIWVNNYNITPYYVPFGGMKQSGFGRDNGMEVLHEYTTTKSIYYLNDLKKFNVKF